MLHAPQCAGPGRARCSSDTSPGRAPCAGPDSERRGDVTAVVAVAVLAVALQADEARRGLQPESDGPKPASEGARAPYRWAWPGSESGREPADWRGGGGGGAWGHGTRGSLEVRDEMGWWHVCSEAGSMRQAAARVAALPS
jgi:hypothetical protein